MAYDGPIEGAKLIDPEPFDSTMQDALSTAGYKVVMVRPSQLVELRRDGFRQVYVTDMRSWRRAVEWGDTVLVARPKKPDEN